MCCFDGFCRPNRWLFVRVLVSFPMEPSGPGLCLASQEAAVVGQSVQPPFKSPGSFRFECRGLFVSQGINLITFARLVRRINLYNSYCQGVGFALCGRECDWQVISVWANPWVLYNLRCYSTSCTRGHTRLDRKEAMVVGSCWKCGPCLECLMVECCPRLGCFVCNLALESLPASRGRRSEPDFVVILRCAN